MAVSNRTRYNEAHPTLNTLHLDDGWVFYRHVDGVWRDSPDLETVDLEGLPSDWRGRFILAADVILCHECCSERVRAFEPETVTLGDFGVCPNCDRWYLAHDSREV